MWTSPSTNGAFGHCRKSTKVLISTPSNGEPGRLDWSAQLLKLLPRYATDFSTSFSVTEQYNTRVKRRVLSVCSPCWGIYDINSLVQTLFPSFILLGLSRVSPFCFCSVFCNWLMCRCGKTIYLSILLCRCSSFVFLVVYAYVWHCFCSPYSSVCVWLSVCRSISPGVWSVG